MTFEYNPDGSHDNIVNKGDKFLDLKILDMDEDTLVRFNVLVQYSTISYDCVNPECGTDVHNLDLIEMIYCNGLDENQEPIDPITVRLPIRTPAAQALLSGEMSEAIAEGLKELTDDET